MMDTKRPELPEWATIPYVIGGLAIAVWQPVFFAFCCIGYLIAEQYLWTEA